MEISRKSNWIRWVSEVLNDNNHSIREEGNLQETLESTGFGADVIMQRYFELNRLYGGTDKRAVLEVIDRLLLDGKYAEASQLMDTLPDKKQLLEGLFSELRGKSVYTTWKKISKGGENADKYSVLKGLFSLGTHMCIECEKGRKEYEALLYDVAGSIQEVLCQ